MGSGLKIEEGGFYKASGGSVEGPMRLDGEGYLHSPTRGFWAPNGRYGFAKAGDHGMNLVERVHVLTDAELQATKKRARTITGFAEDGETTSLAFETEEGGMVVLARWPEGYILRYHGEIVWRSWKHDGKIASDRARADLNKFAEDLKKSADDAVSAIRDKIEEKQHNALNKALIGAIFNATRDVTEEPEANLFAIALNDLRRSTYTKARAIYTTYMERVRRIGEEKICELALVVLNEELKKASIDPKATLNEAVAAAERRLLGEVLLQYTDPISGRLRSVMAFSTVDPKAKGSKE